MNVDRISFENGEPVDQYGVSFDREKELTGRERRFLHLSTRPQPKRVNWLTENKYPSTGKERLQEEREYFCISQPDLNREG